MPDKITRKPQNNSCTNSGPEKKKSKKSEYNFRDKKDNMLKKSE